MTGTFRCCQCAKVFRQEPGPSVQCTCGSIYEVWTDWKAHVERAEKRRATEARSRQSEKDVA